MNFIWLLRWKPSHQTTYVISHHHHIGATIPYWNPYYKCSTDIIEIYILERMWTISWRKITLLVMLEKDEPRICLKLIQWARYIETTLHRHLCGVVSTLHACWGNEHRKTAVMSYVRCKSPDYSVYLCRLWLKSSLFAYTIFDLATLYHSFILVFLDLNCLQIIVWCT